jgi:iron(III) transport system ATP-binding protein
MKPLLQVKHITKRYSGQTTDALHHLSLQVYEGELMAVVGASGSGKTTLLKIIAALEEADAGEVLLRGQPVAPPSQQLIAGHPKIKMVFQDNKLFPNFRIYDTIQHSLRSYSHTYQQQRIAEVLELCNLTHLQHKYPRELSGGEGQRATIARALADEPELLLLDEPFSHLDLPLKRQLKKDIEAILQQSGITAILVTHDTADALSMADRIALIQHGQLIQTDVPQKIYRQPATPYVAGFFGEVNIVEWSKLQPCLPQNLSFPANRSTLVCLRAEDISLGTPDNYHCKGKVTGMDYLGAYTLLEVSLQGDITLLCRTPATEIEIKKGAWLPILIDTEKIHFFNQ